VGPYLGAYAHGWRLTLDDSATLRLIHDQRPVRLGAMPDGGYVGLDGFLVGQRVQLSGVGELAPQMEIEGFPPVAWLTGA
jgi:hypothetical protein